MLLITIIILAVIFGDKRLFFNQIILFTVIVIQVVELLRYLNHVADRYDLRRDIQFETRVTAARWSAGDGMPATSNASSTSRSAATDRMREASCSLQS